MNMFLIGMTAGIAIFAAVTIIVLLFRLTTEIAAVKTSMNMLWIKILKIERMSETTMGAAENFVDALRRSAEDMMGLAGGPNTRPDDFRDLRQTFEDGIRDLEDDSDDEERDQWKKNK